MEKMKRGQQKLTQTESVELKNMQNAYNKFLDAPCDQVTAANLWERNFSGTWGDLDNFVKRMVYLEKNKEDELAITPNNIDELKTIYILWKKFWNKKISRVATNTIKISNTKNLFNTYFMTKKVMQVKNTKYELEKILKKNNITCFEDFQKIIKTNKSVIENSKMAIGIKKEAKSYLPEKFPLYG